MWSCQAALAACRIWWRQSGATSKSEISNPSGMSGELKAKLSWISCVVPARHWHPHLQLLKTLEIHYTNCSQLHPVALKTFMKAPAQFTEHASRITHPALVDTPSHRCYFAPSLRL